MNIPSARSFSAVATLTAAAILLAIVASSGVSVHAQGRGGAPAQAPRAAAGIDLTGYWVSLVTEDWRYRMITPAKGDFGRVPLTPKGTEVANSWNPAADAAAGNQCKAFGAANLLRVPGRLHITWQDDTTLKIDADAGTQTRLLRFGTPPPAGERTWQGNSAARWESNAKSLNVATQNMRAGYLRFNGVPYSENATLTEHFDMAPYPGTGGGEVLVVTTIVEDPQYLRRSFIVSNHFKKERDGSKWNPIPCTATW